MIESLFPLSIFPEGSLSSSVITTVWIGVFVVAFFNLRFGWMLSGLVVPGYLVPLILLKPWAVAAILVEGMTAYSIVWFFSQFLSRYGLWSALFGRDRFFALVLVSIVTRVSFDAWILPVFGSWLNGVGIIFDYRNELHSLGLVIVALVANQFWKTGLIRGLPPLLITLLVTWFIVKYLLLPYTNFGLGNLSYMYEDMAASILASPKAYIILVVTAFVASRMNLRYGWEFNGILIPALLALQWYEPIKILISFAEAFIILWLAILTLKLPLFSNSTIEGARKLLLFFNIAFLYKILLSYFILSWMPDVKISDYFAFGYLLSTLMAIKMHDKGIAIRMTRATIQTSLVSIVIASLLGFILTLVPNYQSFSVAAKAHQTTPLKTAEKNLLARLQEAKLDIYRSRLSQIIPSLPHEIETFEQGVKLLLKYSKIQNPETLKQGRYFLESLGFKVELLEQQYLLIVEANGPKNWGVYVFNLNADNELLVELTAPLETRGLMDGVGLLFKNLNARTLAISGSDSKLFQNQTLFDHFHRLAGRRNVLQVHTYTTEISRSLAADRHQDKNRNASAEMSIRSQDNNMQVGELWVKRRLPEGLELAKLQKIVGRYAVNWGETSYRNPQREDSREGYAELILNRKGLRRLLISSLLNAKDTRLQVGDQRIEGYLQEWLLGGKGQIAQSGTDAYQIPKARELLYLDEEVLTPLLGLINEGYIDGEWKSDSLEELQTVDSAAQLLGYELMRYHHSGTNKDYLVLFESERQTRRYWGTFVFRLGVATPFVIQTPRPLFEVNSFEVAVSLFERMQAKALLIGGTHPLTNRDYSSDLVRSTNQNSLFTLVNQVLMRESHDAPLLAVQCRALGQEFGEQLPDADMLVSFDDGASTPLSFNLLQQRLIESLDADNWRLRFVDGTLATSGYQVGGTPQARYVEASTNKGFALLWVSPLVRSSFKQQRKEDSLSVQILSLGIPSVEDDLFELINSKSNRLSSQPEPVLAKFLRQYQDTQDIVLLKILATYDPKIQRVVDKHTKQAFLLLHNQQGELVTVGNLNPLDITSQRLITIDQLDEFRIKEFIETRATSLVFESTDKDRETN